MATKKKAKSAAKGTAKKKIAAKRKAPARKKVAAKSKPAAKKKTTATKKKAPAKKAAPAKKMASTPIKQKLTKSSIVGCLAEENGLTRAQVNGVLESLENVMMCSIKKSACGEFMLPGMFKITLRKIPARKAGTLIRNPATGEMMKAKAKPASVRVKVRPLAKLKKAATA